MMQFTTRSVFLAIAATAALMAADVSPAEEKLRALLAAAGSDEAAARFVEQHFDPGHFQHAPAESITRQIRAIAQQAGELKIVKLTPRGADQVEALLGGSRVRGQLLMRLTVAPAAPHLIKGWGTMPAIGPDVDGLLSGAPGTEVERLARIRSSLESAAQAHRFSGAMLVARGESVLFATALGSASLDPPEANTLKTKFHLGSMPKMFTAIAALQLVQRGKLKLDVPISEYLPDYPNQEHARKITLHHLLTHTSGLGDYFGPEFEAKKGTIRKLEDYFQFFAAKPLRFEPGERWSYSNAGMHLAGILVERVAGMSYYDYIQRHIFDRAGMKSSGNNRPDERVPGLATGYSRFNTPDVFSVEPATRNNLSTLPPKGGPAGGGYSTLGDLHAFARALLTNRLLGARHTELLTGGKVAIPGAAGAKYAYGFEEMPIGAAHSIGHSGGAPGMNAMLRIFPETGLIVVILSNYDPPFAQMFAQRAAELMARP
jgi:D-alanyl-D-alanine carboxypeptidase